MCCTLAIKQKPQSLFDQFSYICTICTYQNNKEIKPSYQYSEFHVNAQAEDCYIHGYVQAEDCNTRLHETLST